MGLPSMSTQRADRLSLRTLGATDISVAVVGEASLPHIHSLALRGSERLAEDLIALKQKYILLEADNRRCKVEIRKLQREQVVQQHEAEDMEASNQRMYIDSVIVRRTGGASLSATQQSAAPELEASLTARTGMPGTTGTETGTGTGTLMQHMREGHKRLMAERDALTEELSALQRSLRATRVAALEAELCDLVRQAAAQDATIVDLRTQLEAARAQARLRAPAAARQSGAAARSRPQGYHPTLDLMGRQIAVPPGQDPVLRGSSCTPRAAPEKQPSLPGWSTCKSRRPGSAVARASAALRPTKAAAYAAAREAKSLGRKGNITHGQDKLGPRPSVPSSAGSGSDNMYCSSVGSMAELGQSVAKAGCGAADDKAADDSSAPEWTVLDDADAADAHKPGQSRQAAVREQEDTAALGHAATIIQAAYRGRRVRKGMTSRAPQGPSASAQYLQALPGQPCPPAAEAIDDDTSRAATRIQATFRGRQVRRHLAQHRAASPAHAAGRPGLGQPDADDRELALAAIKVQAAFRGHRVRKHMHSKAAQPVVAPAIGRPSQPAGYEADPSEEEMARHAIKIQAAYRGHAVRHQLRPQVPGSHGPSVAAPMREAPTEAKAEAVPDLTLPSALASGGGVSHREHRQAAANDAPANLPAAPVAEHTGMAESALAPNEPADRIPADSQQSKGLQAPEETGQTGMQQPQDGPMQTAGQDAALVESYITLPAAASVAKRTSETHKSQKMSTVHTAQQNRQGDSISAVHGQDERTDIRAYTLQVVDPVGAAPQVAEQAGDGDLANLPPGPVQKQTSRKPSRTMSGLVVRRPGPARQKTMTEAPTSAGDSRQGSGDSDAGRQVKKGLAQSLNGVARLFGSRKSGEVA